MTIMIALLELSASIIVITATPPPPPPLQLAYAANQMLGNTAENLDTNDDLTAFSSNSQRAIAGKNVYVVWQDDTPGNSDIFFKRSTDGGETFDDIQNLSDDAGFSNSPQIAVSGRNNVYVVWVDDVKVEDEEDEDIRNSEIFFRRSTDGGKTFDDVQNLSDNAGRSLFPEIAVSGRHNVYVVWNDNTPGNNEILFRRSTDGGGTFENTENLSNNAGDSIVPQIAVSRGHR